MTPNPLDQERDVSVHDAEPADIYIDAKGKLWRCIYICREPTVCLTEIEPAPNAPPQRISGGVSGLMWHGFTRIHRPAAAGRGE